MLGSGAGARRLGHRHPCGAAGRRHDGREEGAIARTPKTTETKPARTRKTAGSRSAAPKAAAAGSARPRAGAATKAGASAAPKTPARPKTGPGAATGAAARTGATAAPKTATRAKPASGARTATAARRAAPEAAAGAKAAAGAAARAKAAAAGKGVAATSGAGAAASRAAPAARPGAKATSAAAPKAPARAKAGGAPAAPRPARGKRRERLAPDRLALLVAAAMKSLEDDKAEDIVLLDVTGRADYADRLIIATGKVERQLQAMAQHLDEALGKAGLNLRRDAIQASPDWVLIDAGDLVIHLFRPEARELYRIERMWGPESPGAGNAPAG